MKIENKIDKNLMTRMLAKVIKYVNLQKSNNIRILILIMLIGGPVSIFNYFVFVHELIILIVGLLAIPYGIFLIFRWKNTLNKAYKELLNLKLKSFDTVEYVYKTYEFDKKDLVITTKDGDKTDVLKLSFDGYYKIWIERYTNFIIIQFNQKQDVRITVIESNELDVFKKYCLDNNIEYSFVEK
ncbi:MAG: hypothetical protein E7183_02440 [Erysipelotrichaceae bacterium]|nr:hypothetical protein [Erysipelotrichaceae bacterium]